MNIQYRNELGKLLDAFDLPKVVLECGVAEGWFTKEILKWDLDKLYLVDAWEQLDQLGDGGYGQTWHNGNYQQVLDRVEPFKDKVVILKGLSWDMAEKIPDNSLGMVYIDADHSYESVKKDLEAYYSKVVPGGIISGHDILNPAYGVKKAVEEFCEGRFELNIIPDEEPAMASYWFLKL
jgi:hypothetical protein